MITWASLRIQNFHDNVVTQIRSANAIHSSIKDSMYLIDLEMTELRKYEFFHITSEMQELPVRVWQWLICEVLLFYFIFCNFMRYLKVIY